MRTQDFLRQMITLLVFMLLISFAQAEWPANSDSNMVICDHFGPQALPKVAPTSDGGCYISWYDAISGNYNMYLQYLNNRGEIMWAQNGLLISDHPQDTWLTHYSLTVDHDDYAVVVFNDIRSGGD